MMIDTIIAVMVGGFIGFIFGILFIGSIITRGARNIRENASCENCVHNCGKCEIWEDFSPRGRCSEWRIK